MSEEAFSKLTWMNSHGRISVLLPTRSQNMCTIIPDTLMSQSLMRKDNVRLPAQKDMPCPST
jgi:hypothetical protein